MYQNEWTNKQTNTGSDSVLTACYLTWDNHHLLCRGLVDMATLFVTSIYCANMARTEMDQTRRLATWNFMLHTNKRITFQSSIKFHSFYFGAVVLSPNTQTALVSLFSFNACPKILKNMHFHINASQLLIQYCWMLYVSLYERLLLGWLFNDVLRQITRGTMKRNKKIRINFDIIYYLKPNFLWCLRTTSLRHMGEQN